MQKVNAHIHLPPNFSAFDSVVEAVDQARSEGIRALGVSNYYDYTVYAEFTERASAAGIVPLYGIEVIALIDDLVRAGVKINDPGNPGKMYLCGKGISRFAPMDPAAQSLLDVIRANDSTRMAAMIDRLASVFAERGLETGLDDAAVRQRVVDRHGCPPETVYLQERHVAQAFQEVLFESVAVADRPGALEKLFGGVSAKSGPDDAAGIQNEIRSHLMKAGKPGFVPETFVGFEHAYDLVLALGGIPSYPTLADGTSPICPFEASLPRLIADLKDRKVPAAEFIPVRNTAAVLREYVVALRNAGLFVTAGTEHNTRERIPIEPTCLHGEPIPDEVQAIFWEGACVVAAHQDRLRRGAPGFLDVGGDSESRIAAFAAEGAARIAP